MANPQHDDNHAWDPELEECFSFKDYYAEDAVQLANNPANEFQIANNPSWESELCQQQTNSLDTTSESLKTPVEPAYTMSQPPPPSHTEIRVEHICQDQVSETDASRSELQHVVDELEEVELRLKKKELQRKRRLLEQQQRLPTIQQAQLTGNPHSQGNQHAIISVDAAMVESSQSGIFHDNNHVQAAYPTAGSLIDSAHIEHNTSELTEVPHASVTTLPQANDGLQMSGFPPDPSSSEFVGYSDEYLTGSINTESIDHAEMQVQMPDPESYQSSMPLIKQRRNSAQPISTPNLPHQELPSSDHSTSALARKRVRSPRPTETQRFSAFCQQITKKAGAPGTSFGLFCSGSDPPPKRCRTSSQKQNKRAVQDAGGACFLCVLTKKTCSEQRPCRTCTEYWHKRVDGSTNFTWTCDLPSKLADFVESLFIPESTLEKGLENYLAPKTSGSRVVVVINSHYLFDRYLLDVVDSLEIGMYRSNLKAYGPQTNALNMFSYTHSIIRWQEALLFLNPQLLPLLVGVRAIYKRLYLKVLTACDVMIKSSPKEEAIILMAFVSEEIRLALKAEILEPSLANHLQSVLKSRLKVLCAQALEFRPTKELTSIVKTAGLFVDAREEISSCLPPHFRGLSSKFWAFKYSPDDLWELPPNLKIDKPGAASCLLIRSISHECRKNTPPADDTSVECPCGWMFDSIPSGVIQLLGHSANSFAQACHGEPWVSKHNKIESCFPASKLMEQVFGFRGIRFSSLKKMAIYRQALCIPLYNRLFAVQKSIIGPDIRLKNDLLRMKAETRRHLLLNHVLGRAAKVYHLFWLSLGENYIHRTGTLKLFLDFLSFVSDSPECKNLLEN